MTTIVTTTINNGDVTDADIINANFTSTKTAVNGNLSDENLASNAALAISKLAGYPADGTKSLLGDGTWGSVGAGASIGYAVGLPASPTSGQEYILVDSVTLPTYQWRFRYNSGSSNTDKWEFIGGSPLNAQGTMSNLTNAYTTIASVTAPRSGVYLVRGFVYASNSASAPDPDIRSNGVALLTLNYGSNTARALNYEKAVTISNGWVIDVRAKANGSDLTNAHGSVSIIPIRVS